MKIALITIATGGPRYTQYVAPLLESARKYFPPHTSIVYTDSPQDCPGDICIGIPDLGWPRASLMRFHHFLASQEILDRFDHVFFCDVDMLFVHQIVPTEICGDGITAVLHPGLPDSFERRPQSSAYIAGNHPYFQGCFFGGRAEAILLMAHRIARMIDADDKKGIMAIWYDESHLNRFLLDEPPAIVLSPAYCWPDPKYVKWKAPIFGFTPKIRHLEKPDQGTWKDAARK